jgi:N-acetylglucosamine malate deacetylase 1
MTDPVDRSRYDVVAFGAHPDDLEVVLGGTAARLVRDGMDVLFVDLCDGEPVHLDHAAVTDIVVNGVFYARLPKWNEVTRGATLADTEPHEIDRLFFGHCRMEPPWDRFDFAVDVTDVHSQKLAAITVYESVFSGDQTTLLDKYTAEDRYVGSLVEVQYAEAFKARSPLLVESPAAFLKARFG